MRVWWLIAAIGASLALIWASCTHQLPFLQPTEAFGFVTGAWCVGLAVKEHLWNWPIGIASNVFYVGLFWHNKLFADMTLQGVYIILGILGWYWWLRGGQNHDRLPVTRASLATLTVLAILVSVGTAGMTLYLRHVHDSAPFWDALTTALSLAAQYLLTKKRLENWYVWISVDVIYIGLYLYKHLALTAGLYGLFIVLCVLGLRAWRLSLANPVKVETMPLEVAHG